MSLDTSARLQLKAQSVQGIEASRSILLVAGVCHQVSANIRMIKLSNAKEPHIHGVEYVHRNRRWMDLLLEHGGVNEEGTLPQLNAGAVLADFVIHDLRRAPHPDDIDFDCLEPEDRLSFCRLVQLASPDTGPQLPTDNELEIGSELISERYRNEFNKRLR